MNGTLARVDTAVTASRRLVSDASHELRTPVAVMRTELEVAARDVDSDWSATGDVLLDELSRLQSLVDDLLLLARGDERPSPVGRSTSSTSFMTSPAGVAGFRSPSTPPIHP